MCNSRLSWFISCAFIACVILGICVWKSTQYNPTCDEACKWGSLVGCLVFAYTVAWAIFKFDYLPTSIICSGTLYNYHNQPILPPIHPDITAGLIVYCMQFPCLCPCHFTTWFSNKFICCATKPPAQENLPVNLPTSGTAPKAPLNGESKDPVPV